MATLAELCAAVPGARLVAGADDVANLSDLSILSVRDDSRTVGPGDLFVAVPGTRADGRGFVADALARGAAAIACQAPLPDGLPPGVGLIEVPSARKAVGLLAARHFGAASAMTLLAVTGTNGKTTTTYLLESMLAAAGRRPGVFGTVTYRYGDKAIPAPLTTPGA